MEWYWLVGIVLAIYVTIWLLSIQTEINAERNKNKYTNNSHGILASLVCILFVLIMIYDKI